MVDVDEVYSKPSAQMTDDECKRPAGAFHRRQLYSTTYVAHWATILIGGKGDDPVNAGAQMPAGCAIESVRGLHYHGGAPEGSSALWLSHEGKHGFEILRNTTDPRSIDTIVHWWHIGTSGIFVRVVYDIFEPDGANCLVTGMQTTP